MKINKQILTGKGKTVLCIVACAIPIMLLLIFSGNANLSWLGLLACVGMHLVMMKMMPGHSCHKKTEPQNQETEIQTNKLNA